MSDQLNTEELGDEQAELLPALEVLSLLSDPTAMDAPSLLGGAAARTGARLSVWIEGATGTPFVRNKEAGVRQRVCVVAVITVSLVAFVGPAAAETGGGANNVVVAKNTLDGNFFSRSGVMVTSNPSDTVANANLAIAESTDCTGCHTVSVAMQVVIVEDESPSDFRPANAATATNANCQSCQTYAFAYQYIIQPGTMVTLSGSAQQAIADIRLRVSNAAGSGAAYFELKPVLDGLCNELAALVTTDLGLENATACADSSDQKEQ